MTKDRLAKYQLKQKMWKPMYALRVTSLCAEHVIISRETRNISRIHQKNNERSDRFEARANLPEKR